MTPLDKKSKFLILTIVVLILLTISASFYKFLVIRDYEIINDLDIEDNE